MRAKPINAAIYNGSVNMNDLEVGNNLNLHRSKIQNNFAMYGAHIGGDVLLADAQFAGPADLIDSKIDRALVLPGTKLTQLDLSDTRIEGVFFLGSGATEPTKWITANSVLILRNTSVDTLESRYNSWPSELMLEGFTYDRIREHLDVQVADKSDNSPQSKSGLKRIDWYKNWLKKDKQYSPEPYEQLASVLRRAGLSEEANDILYAK
jgi:hypothetical protein